MRLPHARPARRRAFDTVTLKDRIFLSLTARLQSAGRWVAHTNRIGVGIQSASLPGSRRLGFRGICDGAVLPPFRAENARTAATAEKRRCRANPSPGDVTPAVGVGERAVAAPTVGRRAGCTERSPIQPQRFGVGIKSRPAGEVERRFLRRWEVDPRRGHGVLNPSVFAIRARHASIVVVFNVAAAAEALGRSGRRRRRNAQKRRYRGRSNERTYPYVPLPAAKVTHRRVRPSIWPLGCLRARRCP